MAIKIFLATWGMVLLAVSLDVFGAFVVKMKLNEMGAVNFGSVRTLVSYFILLAKSPLTVAGAVSILVSPIPYAIALSRMEVSIVYPMVVALTSLILLPLTIIFFKESFSFYKVIGISLVIFSMYLLNK